MLKSCRDQEAGSYTLDSVSWRISPLHSSTLGRGLKVRASWRRHSQYVHSKHPPDKEYRNDGPRDVNDPVADCLRLPKVEHAAMLAAPTGAVLLYHRRLVGV